MADVEVDAQVVIGRLAMRIGELTADLFIAQAQIEALTKAAETPDPDVVT